MGEATFYCYVSPRDQKVTWYSGTDEKREILPSSKYVMSEDFKTRTLTIKECVEEDRYEIQCVFFLLIITCRE